MNAAAVDRNARGWLDVLARQPGAERHDGWVITDVPFSLCNSIVMPCWDEESADERIDAVLEAGRDRGVPQLWWTGRTCTPADLVERLEARGVVTDVEPMPGMALALSELPSDAGVLPRGLRIEPVIDAAGLAAFAEPFGSAFGFPPDGLASVIAAFADFAASGGTADDLHHWVGFEGDRAVAASSVLIRDGVAGLYDVSTVADARGRGYGAALSVAALRGARDAGAQTAILHASPAGLPIYERLGFETLTTVRAVETRASH